MRTFSLLALALWLGPGTAQAELSGTVWTEFNRTYVGTDGPVYAACDVPGLGRFFGGAFHHVGDLTVWNIFQVSELGDDDACGSTCAPVGDGFLTPVRSLAAFQGELIAGGDFPGHLFRWDGSTWTQLGDFTDTVWELWANDGVLYVGGDFGLRSWNGTTWRDYPWIPLSSVAAVTIYQGQLVAAGFGADYICVWNGSDWEFLYPYYYFDFNDVIYAMTVFQDKLYVGGDLHGDVPAGEPAVDNLAYWDGSAWHGMEEHGAQSPAGPVYTLLSGPEWQVDALLVGGNFPAAYGHEANLAYWTGQAWGVSYFGLDGTDGPVYALDGEAANFLAVGNFSHYGTVDTGRAFHKSFINGHLDRYGSTGKGLGSDALCLEAHDGQVFVGGYFAQAGEVVVNGIARWDGGAWNALDAPDEPCDWSVPALHDFDGVLYSIDYHTHGVRRWDGADWTSLDGDLGNGGYALGDHDGHLVVGGAFTSIDAQPCARVAMRVDSLWVPLGAGIAGSNDFPVVRALADFGGDLYAAGEFTLAGGQPAANVARWDGADWHPLGEGVDGAVHALLVDSGLLYVGGDFTHAGGLPAAGVARWDGATWTPIGDTIQGHVYALASFAGHLVAGGSFLLSDDPSAGDLVYWDAGAWHGIVDMPIGGAMSLLPRGDELWIAGLFQEIRDGAAYIPSYGVAVFEADLTAVESSGGGALALRLAHPNPFNPSTTLRFDLGAAGPARLSLHDAQGRRVRVLAEGVFAAGEQVLTWDGRDDAGRALPSGVYFSRLEAEGRVESSKLVLAR